MENRPILNIPLTRTDQILEILGFLGIISLWLLTAFVYPRLPEAIPTHFNFKGEVDNYGDRNMVWLIPGVAVALFTLLTILNRHPYQFNYFVKITKENALLQYTFASRMIRTLKLSLIIIFNLLQWGLLKAAQDSTPHLNKLFLPLTVILILAPLGYFSWQSIKHK